MLFQVEAAEVAVNGYGPLLMDGVIVSSAHQERFGRGVRTAHLREVTFVELVEVVLEKFPQVPAKGDLARGLFDYDVYFASHGGAFVLLALVDAGCRVRASEDRI